MPFCNDCGQSLEDDWIMCPKCGWILDSRPTDTTKRPKECPDCLRLGKSMKNCGICKKNWFCSWCHSQRKRDIRDLGYDSHSWLEEKWVSSGPSQYDNLKMKTKWHTSKTNLFTPRIKTLNRYEPCLKCANLLFKDDEKLDDAFRLRKPGFNIEEMRKSPLDCDDNLSEHAIYLQTNIDIQVEIEYRSKTSGTSVRIITPTEVYVENGVEYFKAICRNDEIEKTFRIDRIIQLQTEEN
jgi:hypothetical protein